MVLGVSGGTGVVLLVAGRCPPSHAGAHQLRSPNSRIVAGTMSTRTSVASSATASASATPERLDEDHARQAEGAEDRDHDRGRAGDQSAGALEPLGHRPGVVAGAQVLLAHARQHQHLVVHRQAEHGAEQQHRHGDVERLRLEVEQPRQVPVLEDPHQGAERGADREQVHDHRLERQQDRAEHHEEHDVGDDEDEGDGIGHAREDERVQVDVVGGRPGDDERAVADPPVGADRAHQGARLLAGGPASVVAR